MLATPTLPTEVRPMLEALRSRGLLEHGVNVAVLATGVCRRLGVTASPARSIAHAALLHDVGKLAIPATVLDHPGPLSHRERALMRDHPIVGERMLRRTPGLEGLAPLVRHSHERWDGQGYPDRLHGHAIPLGARIIAVCDAWDAMRTERVYSAAQPFDEALDALRAAAGSQHDTRVVSALIVALTQDDLVAKAR
jgi:two-component system, cell cycle response regulator